MGDYFLLTKRGHIDAMLCFFSKSFDGIRQGQLLLRGKGIDDGKPTNPGDGMTKSNELFAIKLIDSTEVVNDFGHRFTSLRMALIVSQLVVLDDGAVFVFTFSPAQIHPYLLSVYLYICKALY